MPPRVLPGVGQGKGLPLRAVAGRDVPPLGRARSRQGLPLRKVLFCRWVKSSVGLCRRFAACRLVMPLRLVMVGRAASRGLVPCGLAAASRHVLGCRLAGLGRSADRRFARFCSAAGSGRALGCAAARYCEVRSCRSVLLWSVGPLRLVWCRAGLPLGPVLWRRGLPLRTVWFCRYALVGPALPLGLVR
jgi:hypothetical protein